jgi:hypothetical protein
MYRFVQDWVVEVFVKVAFMNRVGICKNPPPGAQSYLWDILLSPLVQ